MATSQKDRMLTATELRNMGFTRRWFEALGDADVEKPNPHKRSTTMRLWANDRVDALLAERADEWAVRQKAMAQRSATAMAVAETKREELRDEIESMDAHLQVAPLPATLDDLDRLILQRAAADGYGEFTLGENARAAFVRHNRSNYEAVLHRCLTRGRVGRGEGYDLIRICLDDRVDEALDSAYGPAWREHGGWVPVLAAEHRRKQPVSNREAARREWSKNLRRVARFVEQHEREPNPDASKDDQLDDSNKKRRQAAARERKCAEWLAEQRQAIGEAKLDGWQAEALAEAGLAETASG